jgi:uncharacterized protein (DUF2235 family)
MISVCRPFQVTYSTESTVFGEVAMPDYWCLIFSDGTGQRGVRNDDTVRNTNIFQMFSAAENKIYLDTFYDAGLGAPAEGSFEWTRTLRNLWSKATGWGITANIVDCYEALMIKWKPGMKIGLFGFSRGAYTVRCLGGVLATCGIAMTDRGAPISKEKEGPGAKRRRAIAEEAVSAYKIKNKTERKAAGASLAQKYGAKPVVPDVIGVFDTVKALGLPGVMNIANPWKHEFHDNELSLRIPVGLQALSIDENRKEFLPELWEEVDAEGRAAGQIIEQVWFPGVHSDIGGGYDDDWRLADLALDWMLSRLRDVAHLHIPLTVTISDNLMGKAHDERTGMGKLWLQAERTIRGHSHDIDAVCARMETRFDGHQPPYRPEPLRKHPRFSHLY